MEIENEEHHSGQSYDCKVQGDGRIRLASSKILKVPKKVSFYYSRQNIDSFCLHQMCFNFTVQGTNFIAVTMLKEDNFISSL